MTHNAGPWRPSAEIERAGFNARARSYVNCLCGFGIFEFREKLGAPLPCEVHEIPDWVQLVYSTLVDIWSQPWMTGIEVANRVVAVAGED